MMSDMLQELKYQDQKNHLNIDDIYEIVKKFIFILNC